MLCVGTRWTATLRLVQSTQSFGEAYSYAEHGNKNKCVPWDGAKARRGARPTTENGNVQIYGGTSTDCIRWSSPGRTDEIPTHAGDMCLEASSDVLTHIIKSLNISCLQKGRNWHVPSYPFFFDSSAKAFSDRHDVVRADAVSLQIDQQNPKHARDPARGL